MRAQWVLKRAENSDHQLSSIKTVNTKCKIICIKYNFIITITSNNTKIHIVKTIVNSSTYLDRLENIYVMPDRRLVVKNARSRSQCLDAKRRWFLYQHNDTESIHLGERLIQRDAALSWTWLLAWQLRRTREKEHRWCPSNYRHHTQNTKKENTEKKLVNTTSGYIYIRKAGKYVYAYGWSTIK